jgi:hypothetical protein
MKRRDALKEIAAALAFPQLFVPIRDPMGYVPEIDDVYSDVMEDGRRITWNELAADLARWERKGIECEHPAHWQRMHYDNGLIWDSITFLVFGFGTVAQARADCAAHAAFIADSNLGVGQSEDGRAYAIFKRWRLSNDTKEWREAPIGLQRKLIERAIAGRNALQGGALS